MADPRVAVYIDFDNVVISRYDQVHAGRRRDPWRSDNARDHVPDADSSDAVDVRLAEAIVDIGAVLDYASSFGTVALARAYADWSVPANAAYRRQLVDRAVDLTQLFPVSGTKNGADIRLSIDAMEDLVHHEDLTHVVIVGGDSDYIALAQRTKQWGRFVVGIGVAGSTSRALVAACDEFSSYDALPGVRTPTLDASEPEPAGEPVPAAEDAVEGAVAGPAAEDPSPEAGARTAKKKGARRTRKKAAEDPEAARRREATDLLVRALQIAADRGDEDEWFYGGGIKSQMQRMDPGFKEKALGFKTFSAFVASCPELVESRIDGGDLQVRLVAR